MNAQGVESVIIEDLVKIGEDIGIEKGIEQGRKEGRKEGLVEGVKKGLLDLCELIGLPVDDERRAALDAMDLPELEALRLRLKTTRSW